MRTVLLPATLVAATLAAAQAPPATLAHSPLSWDVREGVHPRLGPIRVAVPSESIATPVGKETILSLVFFSCEKKAGRIAVELANAAQSDARSGLYPKQMPRMFCNPRSTAPRVELANTWFVSEIGDAMARGFAPSDLRRCASIDIVQDVALPRGWGADVQHIEIELVPYKRELDSVLAVCAQPQATAQAEAPKPAAAPPATSAPVSTPPPASTPAPASAPAPAPPLAQTKTRPATVAKPAAGPTPPAPVELPWKNARTIGSGRTNVRANPTLDSPVVTQLDPGALVSVQATDTEWWKARPRSGAGFAGYIRQDRLSFQ